MLSDPWTASYCIWAAGSKNLYELMKGIIFSSNIYCDCILFSFLSHSSPHNGCHPIPARQIDVNTLVKHNCQVVICMGKVFSTEISRCAIHIDFPSLLLISSFLAWPFLLLPMKFQPENILVKHGKHLKLAELWLHVVEENQWKATIYRIHLY